MTVFAFIVLGYLLSVHALDAWRERNRLLHERETKLIEARARYLAEEDQKWLALRSEVDPPTKDFHDFQCSEGSP